MIHKQSQNPKPQTPAELRARLYSIATAGYIDARANRSPFWSTLAAAEFVEAVMTAALIELQP